MIPDDSNTNVSRQELIDLLCRITNTDEENNNNNNNTTNVDDNSVIEDGEIITLDDDDDDDDNTDKKEVEDGELPESDNDDGDDDVEELNLRLNALRSLAGAQKHKHSKQKKSKRQRYLNNDIDLRTTIRKRSSSRHYNLNSSNNEDREYLLDKDYRQSDVFDMLLSIISPNNNNNNNTTNTRRNLVDNYDVQQMDIVDDYPIPPPLPPPLPSNQLRLFDSLPPLPPLPPPPPIFNLLPMNTTYEQTEWPRPNFLPQNPLDFWSQCPTDVDLRVQVPPMPSNQINEHISPRNILPPQKPRRKRSRKSRKNRREEDIEPPIILLDQNEEQPQENQDKEEDEEEERLLREQLLRTMSNKRKIKVLEPERIVTIVPTISPPITQTQAAQLPTQPLQTAEILVINPPPPVVVNKSQYAINQRYKRVKANVPTPAVANKIETTTPVVRTTTQAIIQTRNKIVRASHVQEPELDMPQSNPIIITFDDPTTDEDEHQPQLQVNESSQHPFPDEERQAIKRLQQIQEEVLRRTNSTDPKPQPPPTPPSSTEPIPSTDELAALFEKRQTLLTQRSKYTDIQGKMKKKKIENVLLARDIEKLEELLITKKNLINTNNTLLQNWQKEALAIAQTIKQQQDLILQSTIFQSTKPDTPDSSTIKSRPTVEFDNEKLSKIFQDNNSQLLLSILICPMNFYQKLHFYKLWFKRVSQKLDKISFDDGSCLLLRARSFSTQNSEQYWKTCLQSYFLDMNQILCPYELQGSCKAQKCVYQHQYQISNRIEQFLSSKNFDEKTKLKLLNKIENICSIQSCDVDLTLFEKKIADKQYQRCRTLLDRYLSIFHQDFRYFRERSKTNNSLSMILTSVSNQLDSDEFSVERAVAELVEGLELDRTNAQLWCLYLEFSSWHMSSDEIEHLCKAAIKNAQSYDLFWTSFYLCQTNLDELISIYLTYIQSDQFNFHSRSYAICELALFHASLTTNTKDAYEKIKNYLSNSLLDSEHRLYLVLILLYIFVFGSFPRLIYQEIDEHRFGTSFQFEPFICPWYTRSTYAHTQNEIDRFFDDFITPLELNDTNLPLYINKLHYLNATNRYEQSKKFVETLIETFPYSIELWIELLLNPQQSKTICQTLERARKSTGIYYEFVYTLSSIMNVQEYLKLELVPAKTTREKFFFDLCQSTIDVVEQKMLRYSGELHDILILHLFFHGSIDQQQKLISKILNHLIYLENQQEKFLVIYSFFRQFDIGRVFDLVLDFILSIHHEQFECILKPFFYCLLDNSTMKNNVFWFRFDTFIRHLINQSHCQEIYVTYVNHFYSNSVLQRLILSMENKTKIARLCRLFEKHYPNNDFVCSQFRRMMLNGDSTT